jgi:TRAP-type C4-dicarboxylate transport system permease small subunit
MEALFRAVERLGKLMQVVSGIALTFIMLLTVTDVAGRLFGHHVDGTFELVGLGGAVVIGFALPITSWMRGHIFVDFLYQKAPKGFQKGLHIATRFIVLVTFVFIGWNLLKLGYALYVHGEVTLTRQLPFYPVAYGLGVCCFIQCLVAFCEMIKVAGGTYE